MMKQLVFMLCFAVCLTLSACGGNGEQAENPTPVIEDAVVETLPTPTPTPDKPSRPAVMTEVILMEGMEEEVTSTLVQGDGWSFYLPDGKWQSAGENAWTAVYNDKVAFWIEEYPGQSADEIRQQLQAEGYDENLFKNEGTFRNAVVFEGAAFVYDTPASFEYVEGWGTRLAAMARTFEVEA